MARPWAWGKAVLNPAEAPPGSVQTLWFGVPATCGGSARTRGVEVHFPYRFRLLRVLPHEGWEAGLRAPVHKNGPLGYPGNAHWRATAATLAQPFRDPLEFALEARLPAQAVSMPFTVEQVCESGLRHRTDVVLRVLAPGAAPVEVSGAWVRARVSPQSETPIFMTLNASAELGLIGARAPQGGRIDIRRNVLGKLADRTVVTDGPVALGPGRPVVFGGWALQLIWQPGREASAADDPWLPLVLEFEDAAGVALERALRVPVRSTPPLDPGFGQAK